MPKHIGLYTAASTSERISFHTIKKRTGNRVNRVFIDSDTGKEIEREDQTKSFEIVNGQYIMIDPEEVAATIGADGVPVRTDERRRSDNIPFSCALVWAEDTSLAALPFLPFRALQPNARVGVGPCH